MIVNDVNPSKLLSEFWASDLMIDFNECNENTLTVVFSDDADLNLVQQIIDAHDPTPIPPQPTQDDFLIDLELRMTMLELGMSL